MANDNFIGLTTASGLILAVCALAGIAEVITDTPAETQQKANVAPVGIHLHLEPINPAPFFEYQEEKTKEEAKKIIDAALDIRETINAIEFPKTEVQLTSLGSYYITGYTSVECGGSTTTASGTTCHKASSIADSINNPTTCAIDPALHDFGDVFFIEGFGYFIAEDTGSAVKGKHLDLYFWDDEYNYALSITGNYQVYAVEYIDTTFQAGAYDIRDKVAEQVTGWSIKTTEEEENNGIL